MNLFQRVRSIIGELIEGGQRIVRRFYIAATSIGRRDIGTADYKFWDKARHGKAEGYEISGLLLKPLESKVAAEVLGEPPAFTTKNERARKGITEWWQKNHAEILTAYEDAEGLGDNYIVVNADFTISVIPPDAVKPIMSEVDFSKQLGWKTTERYPHPDHPGVYQTIVNEYTATKRVRRITNNKGGETVQTFRNVIGRVPVVHISPNRASNEMFGRPIGEALQVLLSHYNDVIEAGLNGNIRQGRPTPVFKKLGSPDNVEAIMKQYTVKVENDEGESDSYIQFDADKAAYLGGEAEFGWESPQSFAGDTEKLLGLLFYLYVQHSEIPEYVLGNAISSSKASADAQNAPYVKFIEKKQGQAEKWVYELVYIVLGYLGVIDAATQNVDDLGIEWEELASEDTKLVIDAVNMGLKNGIIQRKTAVANLPLKIKDPEAEVEAADAEREELRQKEEAAQLDAIDQEIERLQKAAPPDDDEEEQPPAEEEAVEERAAA